MLVVTRKKGQVIEIGKDIKIMVVDVIGKQVRIGIEAPKEIKIFREELNERTLPKKQDQNTVQ